MIYYDWERIYTGNSILGIQVLLDFFKKAKHSNTRIPWRCDWWLYKERHLVECFFLKLTYAAGNQHRHADDAAAYAVQNAVEDIHMDSGSLEVDETGIPVSMIMVREDGSYIQPPTMQHVASVIHGTYTEGHPVISPDWDFHSLRQTHATALVEAGVPLAVIQKRLGHAKIEMTEHYTDHVTETMERDFQSKLKALYF